MVRATGGLADSITDAGKEPPQAKDANGFSFEEYSPMALGEALTRACTAYAKKDDWKALVANGMAQDWSWSRSAHEYVGLYKSTVAHARETVSAQ